MALWSGNRFPVNSNLSTEFAKLLLLNCPSLDLLMICDNPFFGDSEVQHDSFLEYALERVSRAILWHSIAKALNPSTQKESDRSHLRLTELSHFPH